MEDAERVRAICPATPTALDCTDDQEAIKQSKNNNSQGPDKLNIRHLNT